MYISLYPLISDANFFVLVVDSQISYQGLLANCAGDPLLVSQLELIKIPILCHKTVND